MGYVYKNGFTEVNTGNSFDYSPELNFAFDMEVSSFGGGGGNSAFYGMGSSAEFAFLDQAGDVLGVVRYGNASTTYQASVSATRDDRSFNSLAANVLQHHIISMSELTSQLLIPFDQVDQIALQFSAYASGYSAGMGGEVWFDNVAVSAVPVPPAMWLFGSGLIGMVGMARRKSSNS